jgi:hypothetical protein
MSTCIVITSFSTTYLRVYCAISAAPYSVGLRVVCMVARALQWLLLSQYWLYCHMLLLLLLLVLLSVVALLHHIYCSYNSVSSPARKLSRSPRFKTESWLNTGDQDCLCCQALWHLYTIKRHSKYAAKALCAVAVHHLAYNIQTNIVAFCELAVQLYSHWLHARANIRTTYSHDTPHTMCTLCTRDYFVHIILCLTGM